MSDFNQAIILGNLTRDPEVRYTPNGQAVASFSIATNRRWTDKAGEKQEATEFHNVVAWGKLAEIAGQILYKGRKALISGRLQSRSWEGQDGVKRNTTEIVANELSALGQSKGGLPAGAAGEGTVSGGGQSSAGGPTTTGGQATAGEESQAPASAPKEKPVKKQDTPPAADEINLDDIPF